MRSASNSSQSISARLVTLLSRDLKKPAMRGKETRHKTPDFKTQEEESDGMGESRAAELTFLVWDWISPPQGLRISQKKRWRNIFPPPWIKANAVRLRLFAHQTTEGTETKQRSSKQDECGAAIWNSRSVVWWGPIE